MTETKTPGASEERALTCEEARELLDAHAAGVLAAPERARLRRHLVGCRECAAAYREAARLRAGGGRTVTAAREREAVAAARRRHVAEGLWSQKGRRLRLRTVLVPAFFIWLILQIAGVGGSPPRLELVEWSGDVTVADFTPHEDAPPLVARRGAWTRTGDRARALLRSEDVEFELGPFTRLLVESADPPRARLERGDLRVRGSATVVTMLGIVKVEAGAGRIRAEGGSVEVASEGGRWSVRGPLGERTLAAGESLRLGER